MTMIEQAVAKFPHTKPEDWRQIGEAAVNKNCTVGDRAKFLGPAFCIGGTIRGGTILGGTIEGGTIEGGTIWGGTIRKTPLQIFGACNWPVVISKPGHVAIGCECHTPDYWREHFDGIARNHRVDEAEKSRVMRCVEIAAEWLKENPDAVTELAEPASDDVARHQAQQ